MRFVYFHVSLPYTNFVVTEVYMQAVQVNFVLEIVFEDELLGEVCVSM